MSELGLRRQFLLLGIGLAVSYWLIEAFADFVFGEGSIAQRLFPADANEIWMRLIIVTLILAFTGYISVTLDKRARTERRLRVLQSAVHQTDEAVVVTTTELDPPGPEIIYVNEAFCQLYGYAAEELLGETPRILQGPDSERAVLDQLRRSLERKQRFAGVLTNYRKDGSSLHVELRISPVYDPAREMTHWISVQRDITERERVEAALKESEERYRLLVEGVKDHAICLVGPDGRVANWNVGAKRVFGYEEEEIVGKEISIFFTPEDVRSGAPEQELKKALAECYAAHEGWRVRKDGSTFWASGMVTPIQDEAGNLRGFSKVTRDITEHKRAEEALRQAEEKYRSIFENSVDGIFQATVEGGLVTANPAAARILGYESPEELIASVSDIRRELYVDPDDRVRFNHLTPEHGTASNFETRLYRKDGSVIWVSIRARPLRNEGGGLVGFEGTFGDITERKQVEEALKAQREFLRQVIDNNPSLIFVKDWDGKFTLVNKAVADIYGTTAEELVGKSDADFNTNEEEVEAFLRADREVMETRQSKYVPEEPVSNARTGEVRWFQTIKVPLEPSVDGSRRVLGVSTDITERKEAERRLREAEKRYRTLVEQVPGAIYIQEFCEPGSNKTSATIYASPQIEAQLGYPPQAFVEDPELWINLLHPDDRERVLAEDARIIQTGEPFRMEYRQLTRDGREVWIRDEAILVRDENGRPLYWQGIQQDITEQKRAESALREVREAERRQIARNLHDEVLQELMDTLYSLQVTRLKLRDQEIDIPEIDKEIEDLRKATQSLRDAINNLRRENIQEQPFIHLLKSVVVANRQKAPHIEIDLDVDVSFSSEPSGSIGIELLRIIQEALVNVRRHSWARHVRVSLREEEDFLMAEVVDDGRGFDPETTWGGVGLSAMQERALKLDSDLDIHSEPGNGTRVTVRVPTAVALAAGASDEPKKI